MILLAVETSTDKASVAVLVDGMVHADEHVGMTSHAQWILGAIERLLKTQALNFQDLEGIVFGRGPGSFTGLRVACSIAKGLAYASDLPVYPVSTLAAIIEEARFSQSTSAANNYLAMIDARMNQVYWAYAASQQVSDYAESLASAGDIQVADPGSIALVGFGWETYEQDLSAELQARLVNRTLVYPSASAMIRLVQQGLIAPVSASCAMPVYIRDQVTS